MLDKLTELARLCARLPLALRIAAERAASHPHLRLDDLIAGLRDESALWETLSTGSEDEAEAVRTVFAWSYRALSEQSARLFRLLGLHPGPEFGLHAAAALADLTLTRTRQLLDDLVGAHLLEQTAPDRYQFHDLLRAYAIDQAQPEETSRPARSRATAGARLVSAHRRRRPKPDQARGGSRLSPTASTAHVRPLDFADYDAAVDWSEREFTQLPARGPRRRFGGLDAPRLAIGRRAVERTATGRLRSPTGFDIGHDRPGGGGSVR